eukprot:157233-Prorocentrum_minimum.AAC.1
MASERLAYCLLCAVHLDSRSVVVAEALWASSLDQTTPSERESTPSERESTPSELESGRLFLPSDSSPHFSSQYTRLGIMGVNPPPLSVNPPPPSANPVACLFLPSDSSPLFSFHFMFSVHEAGHHGAQGRQRGALEEVEPVPKKVYQHARQQVAVEAVQQPAVPGDQRAGILRQSEHTAPTLFASNKVICETHRTNAILLTNGGLDEVPEDATREGGPVYLHVGLALHGGLDEVPEDATGEGDDAEHNRAHVAARPAHQIVEETGGGYGPDPPKQEAFHRLPRADGNQRGAPEGFPA